jgi:hypothetical protein
MTLAFSKIDIELTRGKNIPSASGKQDLQIHNLSGTEETSTFKQ